MPKNKTPKPLIVRIRAAVKAERKAADLLGYFQTGELSTKYEKRQAKLDALLDELELAIGAKDRYFVGGRIDGMAQVDGLSGGGISPTLARGGRVNIQIANPIISPNTHGVAAAAAREISRGMHA